MIQKLYSHMHVVYPSDTVRCFPEVENPCGKSLIGVVFFSAVVKLLNLFITRSSVHVADPTNLKMLLMFVYKTCFTVCLESVVVMQSLKWTGVQTDH